MIPRLLLVPLLACGTALAQTPTGDPSATTPAAPPVAPATEPTTPQWVFSGSLYTYVVPDGDDYLQPTVMADRGGLHLEARYNYEGRDTGSLWLGWNLSFGEELTWDLTPMIGGVFGDTAGVAPGYHSTLGWRGFELYSEGEYLFDSRESSDSFFYTWSELTYSPVETLRFGVVIQRTKLYETDFDVQRGLLLGISTKHVDFTASWFNPDESESVLVFSFGLGF